MDVLVAVLTAVLVAVAVAVAVLVDVAVPVRVLEGVALGVLDGVEVGVAVGTGTLMLAKTLPSHFELLPGSAGAALQTSMALCVQLTTVEMSSWPFASASVHEKFSGGRSTRLSTSCAMSPQPSPSELRYGPTPLAGSGVAETGVRMPLKQSPVYASPPSRAT